MINYVKYDDEGKVVSYNIEIDEKKTVNMEALPKLKIILLCSKNIRCESCTFCKHSNGKRIQCLIIILIDYGKKCL